MCEKSPGEHDVLSYHACQQHSDSGSSSRISNGYHHNEQHHTTSSLPQGLYHHSGDGGDDGAVTYDLNYTSDDIDPSSDEGHCCVTPFDPGEETHYISLGTVEHGHDLQKHHEDDSLDDIAAEAQSGRHYSTFHSRDSKLYY